MSFLAFGARRTPFGQCAAATLTSNPALPNIEQPGSVLSELRQVVAGEFLALTDFYPHDDRTGREILGADSLLYEDVALRQFGVAGWDVASADTCLSQAEPTPGEIVLDGFQIEGLPVAKTRLE